MAKNWWFKFDFKVWRNDSELRECSLETKGFWIECLCVMYEKGVYEISGSPEKLARLLSCLPEEVSRCAMELKHSHAADVTIGHGDFTLKSRRLERELNTKEQNRLRKQKQRVTDLSRDRVISNKKEVISNTEETSPSAPYVFASYPINSSSEEKLIGWLDAVAVAVGAGTRAGLADRRWEQACIKAIDSGLDREFFTRIVQREYATNARYTNPDKCVQIAQSERKETTAPVTPKFDLDLSGLYQ